MKKLVMAAVAAAVLLPLSGASCGTRRVPSPPCIEADGEPCDDDPFDLDDHGRRLPTRSPTLLPTVAPVRVPTAAPVRPVTPVRPFTPKRR